MHIHEIFKNKDGAYCSRRVLGILCIVVYLVLCVIDPTNPNLMELGIMGGGLLGLTSMDRR